MPPLLATQDHGVASRQEEAAPHTNAAIARFSTYKTLCKTVVLCRRLGGACPRPRPPSATRSNGFVGETKLWTLTYYSLVNLDTCLKAEAQNWTDLNCRLELRLKWVWTNL